MATATAPASTGSFDPSRRVVIVGGVAGGASCAARLRRHDEDAAITIFERGPDVSFANCGLPYHVAGEIVDRSRLLVTTPAALAARFRIDVHTRTEVVSIDREGKTVRVRALDDGNAERDVPYDALVLSPGARAIQPPPFNKAPWHPRVCTLRNLADMDAIIGALPVGGEGDTGSRPRRAVVIGGGYIGLELAEALVHRGGGGTASGAGSIDVTIVELAPQVMGVGDPEMTTPLLDELVARGIDVRLSTKVDSMSTTEATHDAPCVSLKLSDGTTVDADLVVVAVGVRPESDLARAAGLVVGGRGGIVVDTRMRTSDPNVYAVGDAVQVTDLATQSPACIALAGPANRQGRVAADNIVGRGDAVYTATQGTAIVRVFAQAFALTGLTEKAARRAKMAYAVAHTHAVSHASYFPGSSTLHLKLVYSPHTGKVLGAQAVGADGVDKRMDVLATALRAGMTVEDLADLELCYAPPFGSAKDPVNFLGMAALNTLAGDVATKHVADADLAAAASGSGSASEHARRRRVKLLDVRSPAEAERSGAIRDDSPGGYLCVPVNDLRDALAAGRLRARGGVGACGDDGPDAVDEYLVYCAVGIRGYIACRILTAAGIACSNLSGGYTTYAMAKRSEAAGAAGAAAVAAAAAAAAAKKGAEAAAAAAAHPAAAGVVRRSAEYDLFFPHARPEGSAKVQQLGQ